MQIDTSIAGYEASFEMNDFGQPRLRSEVENIKDVVMFILFSRPGSYPSMPWIGLDIQKYLYAEYDDIDDEELKNTIIEQCEALGVFFNKGNLGVKKTKYNGQPSLMIHVEGKETYPDGYKVLDPKSVDKYLIGLSYDQFNKMIQNVNYVRRDE